MSAVVITKKRKTEATARNGKQAKQNETSVAEAIGKLTKNYLQHLLVKYRCPVGNELKLLPMKIGAMRKWAMKLASTNPKFGQAAIDALERAEAAKVLNKARSKARREEVKSTQQRRIQAIENLHQVMICCEPGTSLSVDFEGACAHQYEGELYEMSHSISLPCRILSTPTTTHETVSLLPKKKEDEKKSQRRRKVTWIHHSISLQLMKPFEWTFRNWMPANGGDSKCQLILPAGTIFPLHLSTRGCTPWWESKSYDPCVDGMHNAHSPDKTFDRIHHDRLPIRARVDDRALAKAQQMCCFTSLLFGTVRSNHMAPIYRYFFHHCLFDQNVLSLIRNFVVS